jgi:[acyl-carrier-protein] S-malonyltransferase
MSTLSRQVVLLFPGQGSQYAGMAAGLYGSDPAFTAHVDTALGRFGNGDELRTDWLATRPRVPIDDVTRAQPLLFCLDYALGRMLLDNGVRPAALLGHSVGELAAAVLAGVLELTDAAAFMRDRVERLAPAPPGGMLTVAAPEHELRPFLARHTDVVVGAVNAPRQTVLSGFDEPLQAIANELRDKGFTVLPVAARTAFHSPALAPLFEDTTPYGGRRVHAPRIPMWSSVTTERLDEAAVRDPALWARQPVAPVLFWPTLDKLLATGRYLLVEAGPGQGLATLARQHPEVRRGDSAVTAVLPARPGAPEADRAALAHALEQIRTEASVAS